jgi:HAD superfamily hydrolase (TIGR01509 family)
MPGDPERPPFCVSHLLLDIDGTIADYNEATGRAALQAAVARCKVLTGTDITSRELMLAREAVERAPSWIDSPTTFQRREALRRVLLAHGTDSDETIREVMAAYEQARDFAIPLFPDAVPALKALHTAGFMLVAASNGDFDLGRLGIADYFAGTHFAVDAGIAKPDRRFFTGALARFGLAPEAALFVGDRHDNDYAPAREVGMHAVLVDRLGEQRASALDASVVRIAALTDLLEMVELP